MEAMQNLLDRIRAGELHGLNVTIPHKQAMLPLMDRLSPAASAIGAANTVIPQEGRLVGDNTDAEGFVADLLRSFPQMQPSPDTEGKTPGLALVLGAGGSARAGVYGLGRTGWEVIVAARRVAQAEELVRQLQSEIPTRLQALPLQAAALGEHLAQVALLVNATPAGMAGDNTSPWPEGLPLPSGCAVYDFVYNPPLTPLLAAARAAGLPAANGLGMLIEQAALSFARWTGLQPRRSALWQAVTAWEGS
jgi:shikimate dehydrogenase